MGELGGLSAGRLGWLETSGCKARRNGAFEAMKNGAGERRERNGRKAEANGDELTASEPWSDSDRERWESSAAWRCW